MDSCLPSLPLSLSLSLSLSSHPRSFSWETLRPLDSFLTTLGENDGCMVWRPFDGSGSQLFAPACGLYGANVFHEGEGRGLVKIVK